MSNTISDLSDARVEVLQLLEEKGGEILGISKIAESRGVGKSPQRRTLKAMESDGLINIESVGNASKISFTSVGRELITDPSYGVGQCHSDVTGDPNFSELNRNRLHGITIDVGVKNSDRVPSNWQGKLQGYNQVDVLQDRDNDFIIAKDKWVFRCHKESVTMQLRQGCTFKNNNSADSFSEFNESLEKAIQWLSNAVGVPFRVNHCEIKRAECAFPEDHQALLADAVPGLDLQDITVHDKDVGQDVIEFDKSKAVPERETLSGVRAEEVARNLEQENRQLALNNQAIKFRHTFESEASIQDLNPVSAVQKIKQVESNQESIESVRSRQDKLLNLKKEEREKVEALEKLVRSNQELVERLVQTVEEKETEDSFDDPVQKIFMETWQDPNYSRPWFQKGYLKAWNLEDSKKSCEVILDKETVEKLKS